MFLPWLFFPCCSKSPSPGCVLHPQHDCVVRFSFHSTMEFITTTKRKPAPIFDGSQFTLNRRMNNGVCYWRHAKRTCPARITTEGNINEHSSYPALFIQSWTCQNLSISQNFNLNFTLTSCLVAGLNAWINDLDEMGPFHILLDEMEWD